MKTLIFIVLALAGMAQAQIVTPSGRGQWGDTVRWGDSNDSSSYIRFRGNTMARDSSGTWVTTADSCSKPVRIGRGWQMPSGKLEHSYEARGSSGNTDSTRVQWRWDSRYCTDDRLSLGCQDWVPAGRFVGDTTSRVTDVMYSVATDAGATWNPTRQVFDVPGGNQIRLCVDAYETGGETGDTTYFRRHVVRTSSIPSGGVPPGTSSGGGGGGGDVNLTGISGTAPATGNGTASAGTQRVAIASNNTPFTVNAAGVTAHDAAVTENPVLMGGYGSATAPSAASTDGDKVRLWLDLNGRLQIGDGGGSITVDNGGTFAVQAAQSGTWNLNNISGTISLPTGAATAANQSTGNTALSGIQTAAEIMDDWDETDRAKVNLIAGQAGITAGAGATAANTPRITHASDDPVTTALQIMDDWDESDRAKVTLNINAPVASVDRVDSVLVGTTMRPVKYAIIDAATSGDNTLLAAVASNKIRVLSALLVSAGTVNVRFESGAGGTPHSGQMNLVANAGFTLPYNKTGWFETASNTLLNLELSAAVSVDGFFSYVEVP